MAARPFASSSPGNTHAKRRIHSRDTTQETTLGGCGCGRVEAQRAREKRPQTFATTKRGIYSGAKPSSAWEQARKPAPLDNALVSAWVREASQEHLAAAPFFVFIFLKQIEKASAPQNAHLLLSYSTQPDHCKATNNTNLTSSVSESSRARAWSARYALRIRTNSSMLASHEQATRDFK